MDETFLTHETNRHEGTAHDKSLKRDGRRGPTPLNQFFWMKGGA
jgi:hypothetical protein